MAHAHFDLNSTTLAAGVSYPALPARPAQAVDAGQARLMAPGLATFAVALALLAQTYLQRRTLPVDAIYLFLCALAVFIVAFPRATTGGARQPAGRLRLLAQGALILAAVASALWYYRNLQTRGLWVVETPASTAGLLIAYALSLLAAMLPLLFLGAAIAGARAAALPDDAADDALAGIWLRARATAAQRSLDYLLFIGAGALALAAVPQWFRPNQSNDALAITALSLGLFFFAFWRMDRGQPAPAMARAAGEPSLRLELLAVLAIVALAAFMRLWQIETIPYGVWYDEGETGLEALRILRGIPYTPMGTYSTANPSLFFYVIALAYKFFGVTLFSVRFVQAMVGILAVPAFYVMLRQMLGWRAAIAGGVLLAASAWHVDFSRFGMPYSIAATLFEILTVVFLLQGLRSSRWLYFALCGFVAGLGMNTYTGFRIFPLALVIYLVYALILNKDRVRQNIPGLLVVGVVGLVTVLPLGTWAWQHRQEFFGRTNQTSVFAGKNTAQERQQALDNSLRRHIAMINFQGDGNGRHTLPGAPALDYISAALFVVGLGYCLYRWRSPSYLLLAAWLVVTMQAGILSLDWEAPQQARTLVAIPPIYAIVAVAFSKVWGAWDSAARSLAVRRPRLPTLAAVSAVALLVITAAAYVNYDRYFVKQQQRSDVFYSFSTLETATARRVLALGPTANRYYEQASGTPAYTFLVGGDTPERPVDRVFFRSFEHMPLRDPIDKTAVYLLEPWRVALQPEDVLRYYPHAYFNEIKDPFGKTMVYEFRIPPEDIRSLLSLAGRYYAGDEAVGAPLLERRDSVLHFDWETNPPPVEGDFNVVWSGALFPPVSGLYSLEILGDGEAQLFLDDQLLLDTTRSGRKAQVDLPKGQHDVILTFRKGARLDFVWTTPQNERRTVPSTALIAVGSPQHGLRGAYYRGDTWAGRPEFVEVDPFVNFRWHPDPIDGGNWSAIWTGKLEAPATGKYMMQLICNDRAWLYIDGKPYIDGAQGTRQIQLELAAGMHDVQIKYANRRGYSELRLLWEPPQGQFAEVPYEAFWLK